MTRSGVEVPPIEVTREPHLHLPQQPSSSSSSSLTTLGFSRPGTEGSTPPSAVTPDSETRPSRADDIELYDLSSPGASGNPSDPTSPSQHPERELSPRSVRTDQQTTISQTSQQSGTVRIWLSLSKKLSLANVIAVFSLAVAAVGLLFYGWRSYRQQTIELWHSVIQSCGQLDPEATTIPLCRRAFALLRSGKIDPPYTLWKRIDEDAFRLSRALPKFISSPSRRLQPRDLASLMRNATNATFSSLGSLAPFISAENGLNRPPQPPISPFFTFVNGHIAALLVPTALFIALAAYTISTVRRQNRKDGPPFTTVANPHNSPVRLTNWEDKLYREDRHMPSEDDFLGRYSARIRDSLSSDSSDSLSRSSSGYSWTSLRSSRTSASSMDSQSSSKHKRSMTDAAEETQEDEGKSESVIQLPTKDLSKVFFAPDTGEFIHLAPWKSGAEEEDKGDSEVQEGDTIQAIAHMGTGASALAGGKAVGDMIIEALDQSDDNDRDESDANDTTRHVSIGTGIDNGRDGGEGIRARRRGSVAQQ